MNEKSIERRIRRKAERLGFGVYKSRQREHDNQRGLYMLANDRNHIVLGDRYDATLVEMEEYLEEEELLFDDEGAA